MSSGGSAGGVKIGKPYSAAGKTYVPQVQTNYDEVGVASWYGPGFHGNRTASGEAFNQHDLTAAHPTLPLPSMVRVTNLKNGKSVVVRINDRGPFAHNRIIDLSKEAAKQLGMLGHGTGVVRVQYLPDETRDYIMRTSPAAQREKHLALLQLNTQPPAEVIVPRTQMSDAEGITVVPEPVMSRTLAEAAPLAAIDQRPLEAPDASKIELVASAQAEPSLRVEQKISTPDHSIEQAVNYDASALNTLIEANTAPQAGGQVLTAPSNTAGGQENIFIQAGTFSVRENAEALSEKLTPLAPSSVLPLTSKSGKEVYRVRLGPLGGHENAATVLARMLDYGIHDAHITRE